MRIHTGFGIRDSGFWGRKALWIPIASVIISFAPVVSAPPAAAQPKQARSGRQREVASDPIQCWWKTDKSAVHIGEQFSVALTCAVVDTSAVKVVVDESFLEPSTLHLAPFQVLGGKHFRDIWNGDRRFFQYRYDLRLIGEDFFGKDVLLPRLEMTYRVQSAVVGGSALTGREQRYLLPAEPIRIVSLVAKDVADIRDAPPDTFGDVEARIFRANVVLIVASLLFTLAVIFLVAVVLRATRRYRVKAAHVERTVPAWAVLRAASRELASVRALSEHDGWNGDLAGRALTALRLAGAVVLSHQISQTVAGPDAKPREGQLVVPRGWRKKVVVSAGITPLTGNQNGRSAASSPRVKAIWDGMSQAFGVFGAARYGRNGHFDTTALDGALSESQDLLRQLRRYYWWPFRGTGPVTRTRTGGPQVWVR